MGIISSDWDCLNPPGVIWADWNYFRYLELSEISGVVLSDWDYWHVDKIIFAHYLSTLHYLDYLNWLGLFCLTEITLTESDWADWDYYFNQLGLSNQFFVIWLGLLFQNNKKVWPNCTGTATTCGCFFLIQYRDNVTDHETEMHVTVTIV